MAAKRERVKNRKQTKTFLMLPHELLHSEEYSCLRGNEIKLLIDIGSQYNGYNNGILKSTMEIMKKRGWNSPTTLQRAKRMLLEKGFVICTRIGGKNRPSYYALTWLPIDDFNRKYDSGINPSITALHLWKQNNSLLPKQYQVNTETESVNKISNEARL